jgi:NhaA family Na+:H+ antiporter
LIKLTRLFIEFFKSEKAGGLLLIFCTLVSLLLCNSFLQENYLRIWHFPLAGQPAAHWINDGLMTLFFLLIGLELEREIYFGELSDMRNALLPIATALGGMIVPALVFLFFNMGKISQAGAGIPMATDIAFAIGILSLLGSRVPASLKVLLTALAVMDDLGAIIVIALFYTSTLSWINLGIALAIFGLLLALNRMKVDSLIPYLIGGVLMWYFMLHSGVHATLAGILLAFAIPFRNGDEKSPSSVLQHALHKPVAFLVLPLFALANTAISIDPDWYTHLAQPHTIGILTGLILGKPFGILLFGFAAVAFGICTLPKDLKWGHVMGIGLLGGIGFTMSIFITLLAFVQPELINQSKIAILIASGVSAIAGFAWLKGTLNAPSAETELPEAASQNG